MEIKFTGEIDAVIAEILQFAHGVCAAGLGVQVEAAVVPEVEMKTKPAKQRKPRVQLEDAPPESPAPEAMPEPEPVVDVPEDAATITPEPEQRDYSFDEVEDRIKELVAAGVSKLALKEIVKRTGAERSKDFTAKQRAEFMAAVEHIV